MESKRVFFRGSGGVEVGHWKMQALLASANAAL